MGTMEFAARESDKDFWLAILQKGDLRGYEADFLVRAIVDRWENSHTCIQELAEQAIVTRTRRFCHTFDILPVDSVATAQVRKFLSLMPVGARVSFGKPVPLPVTGMSMHERALAELVPVAEHQGRELQRLRFLVGRQEKALK